MSKGIIFEQLLAEKYMSRCLLLAKNGRYGAPPNPMVGAVIVHGERIIGEGYHARCGEAHAEVSAVNSVKPEDKALLPESTIYVSLEPCAHYGKTPPCAELIIKTGIPRVVVGCVDSFAKVKGKGVSMLRDAGVQVIVGVLEDECRSLNKKFFTFHEKKRPYVTLKWARSADGYIDLIRNDGEAAKLSTPHTMLRVHRLRAEHQAILVGHNTLLLDHPHLNVVHWDGPQPLKCVLGHVPQEELPEGFETFESAETLLASLYERQIQSLLVEGGRKTLQFFIDNGLWDEAHEECSAKVLGLGVEAPEMPLDDCEEEEIWNVKIKHYKNIKQ